jgi:hypothetical protein
VGVVSSAAVPVSRRLVFVGSVAVGAESVVAVAAVGARLIGTVVCSVATVGSEISEVAGADVGEVVANAGSVVGKGTGRM